LAEIYMIYGREDEDIAAKLVVRLSARWTVWWDKLVKQRFVEEIAEELAKAKCAVVLWSAASRVKDTVIDEVKLAKKRELPIVCVSLDGCDPAYGFGGYATTNFAGWVGDEDHSGYGALFDRLVKLLPAPRHPTRPKQIASGRLPLPTLFLSVSSFETQLVSHGAIKALAIARAPAILVSAWDLVARRKPNALIEALAEYHATGGFILLDSGNYEATRLTTKHWSLEDLRDVLATVPFDWSFGFDKMRAHHAPERTAATIVAMARRDQQLTSASILPVIHAPRVKTGGYKIDIIPEVTRLVAEELHPELIGIPERELGAGIAQRVATMQAIRRELDTLPFYQPIHLLGTGNPWTVAIMAAAGADTFDGLEWCRVVVDHETDRLNHFQHFDLFTDQTRFADLLVAQEALDDAGVDFAGKVAFHNIDYFLRFDAKLREMVDKNRLEAFVTGLLGKAAAEMLQRLNPGLFDS
jgi:hypothetical protein